MSKDSEAVDAFTEWLRTSPFLTTDEEGNLCVRLLVWNKEENAWRFAQSGEAIAPDARLAIQLGYGSRIVACRVK